MKKEMPEGNNYTDLLQKHAVPVFIALAAAIITLILFFITNPEAIDYMVSHYGLLGLLAGEILANATIFLPLPFDAVVVVISATPNIIGLERTPLNIILIAVFAGLGSAIGECTSYFLGAAGVDVVRRLSRKEFVRLGQFRKKIKKSGAAVIFLAAATPFPFDVVGVAAGMVKYDLRMFFIAILSGKILRCLVLAFAGFYGMEFIYSLFLATFI
jgi:membrane protein YqaA with SNARE-associated domain